MSLRKQAKILGITPAYLSMLVNGKRQWKPELYERYSQLVNTSVNSLRVEGHFATTVPNPGTPVLPGVGKGGLEPPRLSAHDPKSCFTWPHAP